MRALRDLPDVASALAHGEVGVGEPACGRHNRTKNRGDTVHRDTDGNWHVNRPDGTELTQPAAA